ncbi:Uncharacterised protein [Salmonella enterica subsp. enterica]|nr:Uncharacterised protein [Salmonella enterica subsp. enterica]
MPSTRSGLSIDPGAIQAPFDASRSLFFTGPRGKNIIVNQRSWRTPGKSSDPLEMINQVFHTCTSLPTL